MKRQIKGKTPQNSSLPPRSQHPHARPQLPRRKSKKRRGGQAGHEKHERALIPTNECDEVETVKVTVPSHCRHQLGRQKHGSRPPRMRC
ncbi:MAG TPA: hypothetical protein DD670_13245 [Planctomycetaceae bacterium]|nr:hypothetical protein [Planctomycetaceae bacterium]